MSSEFKYQFSKKQGEDILVVRGDEIDQVVLDLEEAKSKLFGKKTYVEPVVSQTPSEEEVDEDTEDYWVREVKKEGPNKGKHFKVGKDSGKFMGWTTKPLT